MDAGNGLRQRIADPVLKGGQEISFFLYYVVNIISCPGNERCKFANTDIVTLPSTAMRVFP